MHIVCIVGTIEPIQGLLMSAEPGYRNKPDSVGELYVRSDKGAMVPVKALATVSYTSGPDSLDRFNNLPAVKLLGQGAPGVSSGQAIAVVERIANQVLPADFSYDWGGASFQERNPAVLRPSRLGLRPSWCSSSSRRNTRDGRCHCR